MQSADFRRLVAADPFAYHIAVPIQNLQRRAGQFFVSRQFSLTDSKGRRIITAGVFKHLHLRSGIEEGKLHRLGVQEISFGLLCLHNPVSAAVCALCPAIVLAPHRDVTVKHDRSILAGGGRRRKKVARIKQQKPVCIVDCIDRIQVEHRSGQTFAGFAIFLHNLDLRFFAFVFKHKRLRLHHRAFLIRPRERHVIALRRYGVPVRRFGFVDVIGAER